MPQAASPLPALYGSDALVQVLSEEAERSVFLLAQAGSSEPRVAKPVLPSSGAAPDALEGELRALCRMRSPQLAKVLDTIRVGDELCLVMEHVAGRSLAAILERVGAGTVLLPPELGVILAHDAFAAIEYFYEFERGGRVHGNITARTLLVDDTGTVRLAGFRPGSRPRAEADAQAGGDVLAVAEILGDLQFRMFPRELVQTLPRLLDEKLSGLEAMATAKAFVRGHVPSAEDRATVARWLEEVFPGESKRAAQETARLLGEGRRLLAAQSDKPQRTESSEALARKIAEHIVPVTQPAASASGKLEAPAEERPAPVAEVRQQPVVEPRAAVGSATQRMAGTSPSPSRGLKLAVLALALLFVLGGGWFLLRAERAGHAGAEPPSAVGTAKLVPSVPTPVLSPVDSGTEAGSSAEAGCAEAGAADPEAALAAAEATLADDEQALASQGFADERRREKPAVARFLRLADAAFDRGKHRTALKLASRALAAGGGARAHLALGRYLRSDQRYQDALTHYRAALALDPENRVAAAAVAVLESLLAASP